MKGPIMKYDSYLAKIYDEFEEFDSKLFKK